MSTAVARAAYPRYDGSPRYTRAERIWLGVATLVLVTLTGLPYLYAWRVAPAGTEFSGLLYAVEDGNSYYAKMQQGAHGEWGWTIAFTTAPQTPNALFAFHHALGAFAAASGIPIPVVFQISRWITGALMAYATYAFIARFIHGVRARRLAWLLAVVGGGLGWVSGWGDWLGSQPLDLYSPEAFGVLSLIFNLPHLLLGRAALLMGWAWLVDAVRAGRIALALWAALAWGVATLVVPFVTAVLGATAAVWLVLWAVRERAVPWRAGVLTALAGVAALPLPVYSVWLLAQGDPVLNGWNVQNRIFSPNALHYVVAFLPLLLCACVPAAVRWAWREPTRGMLLAWVAVTPVLVYLPFNLQRRLSEGVQVALAVLAVVGLRALLAAYARRRPAWRRMGGVLLVLCVLPTTLLLWVGGFFVALGHHAAVYRPAPLVALGRYVETHGPHGAHIWASYATGNIFPSMTYAYVYLGHDPETPGAADKQERVRRFYRGELTEAERRAWLNAERIDYVVVGPFERALAEPGTQAFDPALAPELELVVMEDTWGLYRVRRP